MIKLNRTMKKEKLLLFSIILNAFLIVVGGSLVFYKRERIMEKFQTFLGRYETPTEKALASFNNDPLEAVNDSLMIGADSTITCLFLGNSLTYTGVPEEEADKEKRGLTSTQKEKDYVHVLIRMISDQKKVNIKFSLLNIAQFERTFTKYSFEMGKLSLAENKQPDFLFVQIGENVAKDDIADSERFEEEYMKLLSLFPKSKRIITIPFWPEKEKQYAVTNVAIKSDSYLVDISHLGAGTDKKNFASSYKEYAMPGVGAHPGDYGMANIARCLYATFNVIYDSCKP